MDSMMFGMFLTLQYFHVDDFWGNIGTKITMKKFISGLDSPLLSQEKLVVGVLHVVPAPIDSAGVPWQFQGVNAIFKLQHRFL